MNQRAYDIVIIGSGAGGGTIAKELSPLCRDGLRIAVLESRRRLFYDLAADHLGVGLVRQREEIGRGRPCMTRPDGHCTPSYHAFGEAGVPLGRSRVGTRPLYVRSAARPPAGASTRD